MFLVFKKCAATSEYISCPYGIFGVKQLKQTWWKGLCTFGYRIPVAVKNIDHLLDKLHLFLHCDGTQIDINEY